jgi:hypothetical protein
LANPITFPQQEPYGFYEFPRIKAEGTLLQGVGRAISAEVPPGGRQYGVSEEHKRLEERRLLDPRRARDVPPSMLRMALRQSRVSFVQCGLAFAMFLLRWPSLAAWMIIGIFCAAFGGLAIIALNTVNSVGKHLVGGAKSAAHATASLVTGIMDNKVFLQAWSTIFHHQDNGRPESGTSFAFGSSGNFGSEMGKASPRTAPASPVGHHSTTSFSGSPVGGHRSMTSFSSLPGGRKGGSDVTVQTEEMFRLGRSWFYERQLHPSILMYVVKAPGLTEDLAFYRMLSAQVDFSYVANSDRTRAPASRQLFLQFLRNEKPADSGRVGITSDLITREYKKIVHRATDHHTNESGAMHLVNKSTEEGCRLSQACQPAPASKESTYAARYSPVDFLLPFLSSKAYTRSSNLEAFGGSFDPGRIADKYINAMMMLLSFVHYRLSLFILEIFDCSQQPTGKKTLDVDLSVECWNTEEHGRLVFYATIGALVYTIGIPVLFLYLLYFRVVRPGRRHNREEKARYGYMYQKYTTSCWWWELVLMFRKLLIVVWRMFTSGQSSLLQASGAFFFFLFAWAFHMRMSPYLERILNKLDAVALATHVLVMYAGTMFLTDRLSLALETMYAVFIIIVNVAVLVYMFRFVGREIAESIPMMGRVCSATFWIDYSWPAVKAATKFYVVDSRYQHEWLQAAAAWSEFVRPAQELNKRQELVGRLATCGILGPEGQFWARTWLWDSGTSMREGEYYVRWLEEYTRCVDRSTFEQLIQRDFVDHELSPSEQEVWKAAFIKAIRVCSQHKNSLLCDEPGSGVSNPLRMSCVAFHRGRLISAGTSAVSEVLGTSLGASLLVDVAPGSKGGPGTGDFRLVRSWSPSRNSPESAIDAVLEEDGREVLSIPLSGVRIYSPVDVKDRAGHLWPATVHRMDGTTGEFWLRDSNGSLSTVPKQREDIVRSSLGMSTAAESPVGYMWTQGMSAETQDEVVPLFRSDWNEAFVQDDRVTYSGQIEWMQSRTVTAPVAAGGGEDVRWAAIAFADGTVDLWHTLFGQKSHTLRTGCMVRHIYISPRGDYVLTFAEEEVIVWEIPEDKENAPSRFVVDRATDRVSLRVQLPHLSDAPEPHQEGSVFFSFIYPSSMTQGMAYAQRSILAVACNHDADMTSVSVLVSGMSELQLWLFSGKDGWNHSLRVLGSTTSCLPQGPLPALRWDNDADLGGRATLAVWRAQDALYSAKGDQEMESAVPSVLLIGVGTSLVVLEVPVEHARGTCPHAYLRPKRGAACQLPLVLPPDFGSRADIAADEEEDEDEEGEEEGEDVADWVQGEPTMARADLYLWKDSAQPPVDFLLIAGDRVVTVTSESNDARGGDESRSHTLYKSRDDATALTSPSSTSAKYMQSYRLPPLQGSALLGASARSVLRRSHADARLQLHDGSPWADYGFRTCASHALAMERGVQGGCSFAMLSTRHWFDGVMKWVKAKRAEAMARKAQERAQGLVNLATRSVSCLQGLRRARSRAQDRIARRRLAESQFVDRAILEAESRIAHEVWSAVQMDRALSRAVEEEVRLVASEVMEQWRVAVGVIEGWWSDLVRQLAHDVIVPSAALMERPAVSHESAADSGGEGPEFLSGCDDRDDDDGENDNKESDDDGLASLEAQPPGPEAEDLQPPSQVSEVREPALDEEISLIAGNIDNPPPERAEGSQDTSDAASAADPDQVRDGGIENPLPERVEESEIIGDVASAAGAGQVRDGGEHQLPTVEGAVPPEESSERDQSLLFGNQEEELDIIASLSSINLDHVDDAAGEASSASSEDEEESSGSEGGGGLAHGLSSLDLPDISWSGKE